MMKKTKPSPGLLNAVRKDPHGDTQLVQVNPHEIGMLLQMGGAGVRNPKTGLLQFYPAGAMGGGSDPGGDRNGPMGRSGNGIGGGNGGDGGYNGTGKSLPSGQLTIGGPARNYGDPYGANSPTGQALGTQGANVGAALQSQHDYVNASQAYANRSFGEKLLGALTGMVPGLGTQKPTLGLPNSYAGGTYHNTLNPAGFAGGALGIASGIPGMGTLGEQLLGRSYNALGGNNYSFGGAGVDPQTGLSTGSGWQGGGGFGSIGFGGQNSPAGVNHPGLGSNSDPIAQGVTKNQQDQQAALQAATGQSINPATQTTNPAPLGLASLQQAPQAGEIVPGYGYSIPGYGYLAWR